MALLPFVGVFTGNAANVSVEAAFSQASAEVGEAVELQIIITGARNGAPPSSIEVDGLQISYSGASTNVQMNNFNVTMSVTHSYSVIPQRRGTFVVPAQVVEVEGRRYVTKPVTLNVSSGGSSAANGGAADSEAKLAYAELVIPKNRAYVGEVVPIEVRLYVDASIRWQMQQLPAITGEGFTTQKLSQPIRNQVDKDGRTYELIIFKTALTPVKTGHLGVGPVEINCVAQIPQKRKRQRFAPDDVFDPLGVFSQLQNRNMTIRIERNELEVLSLPPNPPKSFAGAVGSFSLASKAAPTKVNVGDPITLTLTITGRGNFDRVNAPKLMEETGWRSYPASNKFAADDEIGISGAKTFEMAVVPESVQPTLPLVEFSYFDPVTEKYSTLHAQRDPLSVAAVQPQQPAPGSSPIAQTSQPPAPSPSATPPSPPPTPSDIRYILTGPTQWQRSFEPIFSSKLFWQLQLIPLLALIAFGAFHASNARKADLHAQHIAQLRQQKSRLIQLLQNQSSDSKTFYESAVQYLQLESAGSSQTPSSIGANEACASRPLEEPAKERIRAIFNACDELRYAGGTRIAQQVSPEKRAEVMQTIKEFDAHAVS